MTTHLEIVKIKIVSFVYTIYRNLRKIVGILSYFSTLFQNEMKFI